MGFFAKSFLRGLAAIVPIAVTIYILWWFLSGAETLLSGLFPLANDPEDPTRRLYYLPGLGIAAGIEASIIMSLGTCRLVIPLSESTMARAGCVAYTA